MDRAVEIVEEHLKQAQLAEVATDPSDLSVHTSDEESLSSSDEEDILIERTVERTVRFGFPSGLADTYDITEAAAVEPYSIVLQAQDRLFQWSQPWEIERKLMADLYIDVPTIRHDPELDVFSVKFNPERALKAQPVFPIPYRLSLQPPNLRPAFPEAWKRTCDSDMLPPPYQLKESDTALFPLPVLPVHTSQPKSSDQILIPYPFLRPMDNINACQQRFCASKHIASEILAEGSSSSSELDCGLQKSLIPPVSTDGAAAEEQAELRKSKDLRAQHFHAMRQRRPKVVVHGGVDDRRLSHQTALNKIRKQYPKLTPDALDAQVTEPKDTGRQHTCLLAS